MGTYDIPLEGIIAFLSLVAVYFSYKFYSVTVGKFKEPTKLFYYGFIVLFVASIFDLLDEFYGALIIDILGEIGFILAFIIFILSLHKLNSLEANND